jgi:hypothetical protein
MGSPDSIKQIVFRPLGGGTDRASLEIALESGRTWQKEIPADAFMKSIAELIKYDRALKPQPPLNPS